MNKLKIRVKISYAFYTPIVLILLKFKGIVTKGISYFWGVAHFYKFNKSRIQIGANCRFNSKQTSNLIGINHKCIISTLTSEAQLLIGDNCGFSGTTIGCFDKIILGNNVKCGANTLITDSDWHLDDLRVGKSKEVIIKDNVWLGYGVIVLKGVTIGENSVIGAGSVVTKNVPSNVIAAGNPCKVIKILNS